MLILLFENLLLKKNKQIIVFSLIETSKTPYEGFS